MLGKGISVCLGRDLPSQTAARGRPCMDHAVIDNDYSFRHASQRRPRLGPRSALAGCRGCIAADHQDGDAEDCNPGGALQESQWAWPSLLAAGDQL